MHILLINSWRKQNKYAWKIVQKRYLFKEIMCFYLIRFLNEENS